VHIGRLERVLIEYDQLFSFNYKYSPKAKNPKLQTQGRVENFKWLIVVE